MAGLWYLLSSVPAPFSLLYIPGRMLVKGDPAATADRIRAGEWLFRLGIAAELLSATLFVFVGLAMYELFKEFDRKMALVLLVLVLLSVPMSYLNELNRIAALTLALGHQGDAQALFYFERHQWGLDLAQVFWGLWLLPLGMLVLRSGYIPRVLGVLLLLAGAGYVAASATHLLWPAAHHTVFMIAGALGGLAEAPTMFWLLIAGAGARRSPS